VSVDINSPEYIERAIQITQERIVQLDQTMEAVQRDLDDALIRADLDKIAPLNESAVDSGSSTNTVVAQHEARLEFLNNSKAAAGNRLNELKGGGSSQADPPPPPPPTAKKS
jgi:hypothetical protein